MKKIKDNLFMVYLIVNLLLSLYLSYMVHFKFKFFGANMVTLGTILTVWIVIPVLSVAYSLASFAVMEYYFPILAKKLKRR